MEKLDFIELSWTDRPRTEKVKHFLEITYSIFIVYFNLVFWVSFTTGNTSYLF